ncbi:MAG: hypothetical protein E7395_00695 [Ruminococcaceae bacterium]|nr:hypothetical protein [Oscillospiraceae bacterium]
MTLTDHKFFSEIVDTSIPELNILKKYTAENNYQKCRRVFASYVRCVLEPEKFFSTYQCTQPEQSKDDILENAEKAIRHYMVSCKIPHDFGNKKVDWTFNPTANGYIEWPVQLNRHAELETLAKAYRLTSDIRYAEACSELFESWKEQMLSPKTDEEKRSVGWRTLECGIRQGLVWPVVFHTFFNEFSDDTLVDWCKSVWEQGNELSRFPTARNWLIMEMNGLLHIGVLNPWLSDATRWKNQALKTLEKEIAGQVYADGVHNELSTDYQIVIIKNYSVAVRLCKAYEINVPELIMERLEKALMIYVTHMMPNGVTPSINDGAFVDSKNLIGGYMDLFGSNKIFKNIISETKPTDQLSFVFEYAGLASLRTGWSKNDSFVFFDGGEFGAGHQHEDKLSFVFFTNGKLALCEGNNYAYDTSDMRKYVLSTYAHNTLLVDSMGQNRRKNYKWHPDMINKKSDLKFKLSDTVDSLSAEYHEGYGEDAGTDVVHRRNLYFVKSLADLKPFVICVDRVYSSCEHSYDIMWHVDSGNIIQHEKSIKSQHLDILISDYSGVNVSTVTGQTEPHMQGWTANSAIQGDFRPVCCVLHNIRSKTFRHTTVLFPATDGLKIEKIESGYDVDDKKIKLVLSDKTELYFEETLF